MSSIINLMTFQLRLGHYHHRRHYFHPTAALVNGEAVWPLPLVARLHPDVGVDVGLRAVAVLMSKQINTSLSRWSCGIDALTTRPICCGLSPSVPRHLPTVARTRREALN